MADLAFLKSGVRRQLNRVGLDVRRHPERPYWRTQRRELLSGRGVGLVLDVGANTGQWSAELRADGYRGRVVCFEPLADAFAALPEREKHRVALGAADGTAVLHVAGNSQSSSLLEMADRHVAAAPHSAYVSAEEVALRRLDSFGFAETCYLKVDSQGTELDVLRGAEETLAHCAAVELELSWVVLYEGQAAAHDVFAHVYDRGFRLIALWQGFTDRATGEILQANAIFARV